MENKEFENLKTAYTHGMFMGSCAFLTFPQVFAKDYGTRKFALTEEGRRIIFSQFFYLTNLMILEIKDKNGNDITNNISFRKYIAFKIQATIHIMSHFTEKDNNINELLKQLLTEQGEQTLLQVILTKQEDDSFNLEYYIVGKIGKFKSDKYIVEINENLFSEYDSIKLPLSTLPLYRFHKFHKNEIYCFVYIIFVLLNNANKDIDNTKNKSEKYLIFWQIQMLAFSLIQDHINDTRLKISKIIAFARKITSFDTIIDELDDRTIISFRIFYKNGPGFFDVYTQTRENAFICLEGKKINIFNLFFMTDKKQFAHEAYNNFVYNDIEKYNKDNYYCVYDFENEYDDGEDYERDYEYYDDAYYEGAEEEEEEEEEEENKYNKYNDDDDFPF